MTRLSEYPNVQKLLEKGSGGLKEEVGDLPRDDLEHLEEVLSVVDFGNDGIKEWREGNLQSVISELDMLYLLRSSFDSVETNKSPDGTDRDFDLYLEYGGHPIWIEVKTPDIISKIEKGGFISPKHTPNKIWNYIRDPQFEEVYKETSDEEPLVLCIGEQIPLIQDIALERNFEDTAPNWMEYVDGLLIYCQKFRKLSFNIEYAPLTYTGQTVAPVIDEMKG